MIVSWIIIALIMLGCGHAFLWRPLRNRRRRQALMKTPLPETWQRIIHNRVPLAGALPEHLRKRLDGLVQVFLAEKTFEPCGGLKMTDDIRVTIAAQACLILTGLPTNHPYPRLSTILVYPAAYSARNAALIGSGVISDTQGRAGESWNSGAVVLSWDHVYRGSADSTDGRNVVFHEFAHQLDQAHGPADGVPDLREWSAYAVWSKVLSREYRRLVKAVEQGQWHLLDAYGATNPAEFFAVATETFFEKPDQMKRKAPDLYGELVACYQLDPTEW